MVRKPGMGALDRYDLEGDKQSPTEPPDEATTAVEPSLSAQGCRF